MYYDLLIGANSSLTGEIGDDKKARISRVGEGPCGLFRGKQRRKAGCRLVVRKVMQFVYEYSNIQVRRAVQMLADVVHWQEAG